MCRHRVAPEMAPTTATDSAPAPTTEPTQAEVAAAVLHLASLAASHARFGVTFSTSVTGEEGYPLDEKGLSTLVRVSRLLLEDRARMRARAADALSGPLHDAVTDVLAEAQTNPEVEEQTEDLVNERMKQMGFALGRSEKKRFIVNSQDVTSHKGASQAAADALVDAIEGRSDDDGKRRGRKAYHSKTRRAELPPVVGPLHRYVPLRDVARYLRRVLAEAELQRRRDALLPLEALRSDAFTEALLDRDEVSFKKRMRDDLERGVETMTEFFLALLRGENRGADQPMTPEMQEQWAQVRAGFHWLAAELMSSSGGDEAVLVQKASEAAAWWIANFKRHLDID